MSHVFVVAVKNLKNAAAPINKTFFAILFCLISSTGLAASLQLSSSVIIPQAAIPKAYTCDGENVSPPLNWSNIPANTRSFALILSDPDAPSGIFYHWIIYNLPVTVTYLPEKVNLTTMGTVGKNSWGKTQYNGPCPPSGQTHRYQFTLYALDTMLIIPNGSGLESLRNAMNNHILGQTTLTAIYSH